MNHYILPTKLQAKAKRDQVVSVYGGSCDSANVNGTMDYCTASTKKSQVPFWPTFQKWYTGTV